jgi:hypothetical protein
MLQSLDTESIILSQVLVQLTLSGCKYCSMGHLQILASLKRNLDVGQLLTHSALMISLMRLILLQSAMHSLLGVRYNPMLH